MNGLVKQVGYLIEHKETGNLIGPSWPFPASPGFFKSEKAYAQADRLIEGVIQETALDLAKREMI
jgi:hypothetical protein